MDDRPTSNMLSTDLLWHDIPGETPDAAVMERRLGAAVEIRVGEAISVYMLTGKFAYDLQDEGRVLRVCTYEGRGIFVDGIDLGPLTYRNLEEWSVPLRPDRRFEVVGTTLWSGAQGEMTLETIMRGTVLESGRVAYLSGAMRGIGIGGIETRLALEVPAVW